MSAPPLAPAPPVAADTSKIREPAPADISHLLPQDVAPTEPSRLRSLFGEILDWMLAPLLLLWPLSIAITYLVAKSIANAPFDHALEAATFAIAEQIQIVDNTATLKLPAISRALLRADEGGGVYYQVIGPSGKFIAGERELPIPTEDDHPVSGIVQLRDDRIDGNDIRVATLYLSIHSASERQMVLVQVAETLEKRAQLANDIIKGVILPQFVILPLAVILVWFGLTRGLAPLTALQQRIRSRLPDDSSPIDERAVPQEIMPLVASFNALLAQVEESVQAQKRFIADAAHQLKTPLAGLRMQAELAQREQTPEELRRSLAHIAGSSERAAHLVKQLLSLARMENQKTRTGSLVALDLVALVREDIQDWLNAAWNKRIDLGLEAPDTPLPVMGNALMLREMLNNLIDNAIRYTPAQGHVTIHVRQDPHHVILEVEDTGPGIPVAERERVMERFYRILGSDTEGSGLGLAIVREIVQQHDAELQILDRAPLNGTSPTGLLIRVTLSKLPGEDHA